LLLRIVLRIQWPIGERLSLSVEPNRVRSASRGFGLRVFDVGKHRRHVARTIEALLESAGDRLGEALRESSPA
jgi:hypothetical protein